MYLLDILLRITYIGAALDWLRFLPLTRETVVQNLLMSLCTNILNNISLLRAY